MSGLAKGPVAEGKTYCCLGNYVVDKAINPIRVDGRNLETYVVNYENSDLSVRIGIDRSDKNCKRYIVVSDDLEIEYQSNKKFFGVRLLDKKYLDDGLSTSELSLDRPQYYHQKIITQYPERKSEIGCLKLISVYFPKLVKNYEKVFAFK
ncbi:MAG TPA: hypothetical protein DEQ09_05705 [Bacteroidales bacterium]|nr:hypothetical protein [Bacteroidales bacterium]